MAAAGLAFPLISFSDLAKDGVREQETLYAPAFVLKSYTKLLHPPLYPRLPKVKWQDLCGSKVALLAPEMLRIWRYEIVTSAEVNTCSKYSYHGCMLPGVRLL